MAIHVIHTIPFTADAETIRGESEWKFNPKKSDDLTLRLFDQQGDHMDFVFNMALVFDFLVASEIERIDNGS